MDETTNPAEEVEFDDRSIEAKLAARFEAAEKAEKPEAEAKAEPDEEPDEEVSESEDSEESAAPETTDEAEEVEFEGKAYKVPKELKDALLRQKDYTQKTQDVAERRRFVETQQEQLRIASEFQTKHLDKVTELHSLNSRLQQFAQVDWGKLADENPAQYLTLDRQQRTLQDAANRAQSELQALAQSFQQEATTAKQKAQAQCVEELKRTFKDFGPDLVKGLDETGRTYGFSGEELANVADPRMIRVLHDAMQYRKLQSTKSIVDKKVASAKPATASARSTPSTTANAKLAEAKSRALKSGKASDVESFLAARFAKSMR
jgi:hypothetical protein